MSQSQDLMISAAVEEDIPVILQLILELAEYEKLRHEVVATEEILRQNLFARRCAEVVIASTGGEVAGFALFFHNFSTFLGKPGIYLEDLFVRPAYRDKGIGKRLLAHLAKLAVERDCGRLEWWVLDWNEPARGFYRALGAEPMEDWTVFRLTGDALRRLADDPTLSS